MYVGLMKIRLMEFFLNQLLLLVQFHFFKDSFTINGINNYGLNFSEVFSLDNNTWLFSHPLPSPRSGGRAVTIQSRQLWFGGRFNLQRQSQVDGKS